MPNQHTPRTRRYAGLPTLAALRGPINDYTRDGGAAKKKLHRNGTQFLRALQATIRCRGRVYSNIGGNAVSGEATLHADEVFIQISEFNGTRGVSLMWRRPLNAQNSVRWDSDGANRYIRLAGDPDQVDQQIAAMLSQFQTWIGEHKPRTEP